RGARWRRPARRAAAAAGGRVLRVPPATATHAGFLAVPGGRHGAPRSAAEPWARVRPAAQGPPAHFPRGSPERRVQPGTASFRPPRQRGARTHLGPSLPEHNARGRGGTVTVW